MLPLPITFVALSPRSAVLASRYGAPRVMAVGLVIVAGGFVLLSMLTPGTPYVVLAFAFAVLGAGMGVTAAPATGEIMSAVPLSKAGVGSAVNDTTRELGGALGIAILGSIANSAYRAAIDLSGLGLGAAVRSQGEDSIGTAARVAGTVPGGGAVQARAAAAFTDAFNVASMVSIVRRRRWRQSPSWSSPERRARTRSTSWPTRLSPTRNPGSTSGWPPRAPGRRQNEGMVQTVRDPRIERSRRVILEAALEELGDVGYGALTIESVAARAGVGKSTIYRHWPGKLALVEDAFRTLKAQALVPEPGTLPRARHGVPAAGGTASSRSPRTPPCMPALIEAAERDPQVRAFHCRVQRRAPCGARRRPS